MRLSLLAVVIAASSCQPRAADPRRPASRSECERYAARLRALAPEATRRAMAQAGMDRPSERDLALCEQRVTGEMVACALAAPTLDAAIACRPSVDIRPPSAKRTKDECARYVEHVRAFAHDQPALADKLGQSAARECDWYLTKDRYECTLSAADGRTWAACPP
jgi:hypothetical protein